MSTEQVSPSGVPAEAWWSPDDNEWVFGERDGEGRLVGVVRYWRPDGTLVNDCEHVEGKPHGLSLRYHETGEISQRCHFERGALHGLREWFMTDGATTEEPRASLRANGWPAEAMSAACAHTRRMPDGPRRLR